MNRKQGQSDYKRILKAAGIGAGGSMIVTLALTALAASFVQREIVGETSQDALSAGILVLSAICGSLLAVSITEYRRLVVCLSAGAVYFLLLLSCTAMLFDGAYSHVGITALAILGGCGAVILLALNAGKRSSARRRTKYRNW